MPVWPCKSNKRQQGKATFNERTIKLLKHTFAADMKGKQFPKVEPSLLRLGANMVSSHVPLHPIGERRR